MSIDYTFGPRIGRDGVTFRLWAPAAKTVDLVLGSPRPMMREGGWFVSTESAVGPGTRYSFVIDEDLEIADPASPFQPEDVFRPSEVIDYASYRWRCEDWSGRPWAEAVTSEIHIGTFTQQGSFLAAIEKLDDLVAAGITSIELMPVADFSGRWNWGYDGVLLYAPDHYYGRPQDLMALIDAAHARGLMVLLDVVYNHFGPEGNFLPRIAPQFFTERHQTPWGNAIDYRVPEVRAFAIENALHWLDRYRFDGLRLDAVHAIVEPGEPHILTSLSRRVGQLARSTGRLIHLVLESDDNRASWLDPDTIVPAGRYRSHWDDDYHHVWHVILTGEEHGFYQDYANVPHRHLARTLTSGFAYQGDPSPFRAMAPRGEDSSHLPPTAFITFVQNHDQIGNRPHGERLTALSSPEAVCAALAVTLLAPMPPLLFMGDEWGSQQPFPFFCDFSGELGDAVRSGRAREFASAYANLGAPVPDPLAIATFKAAKLDWEARALPQHANWFGMVHELLTIRRREIVPYFSEAPHREAHVDESLVSAQWCGGRAHAAPVFSTPADEASVPPHLRIAGRVIWGGSQTASVAPWSVFWSIVGP